MPVPLYINGLAPDQRVAIIAGSEKEKIFDAEALDGAVEGVLPDETVGTNVILAVRGAGYKDVWVDVLVQEHGLYFTPRVEVDRIYNGGQSAASGWEQRFGEAQGESQRRARAYRFKNRVGKLVVGGLSLGGGIGGAFVGNVAVAVVLACVLWVAADWLAPYVLGLHKRPFALRPRQRRGQLPAGDE